MARRKFRFVDEDEGSSYEVEEIEEAPVEEPVEDEDSASLSADEIDALKRLASVADKLIAMCAETHDADEEVVEEKKEEEIEDEDEVVEEEEKVVETDACKDSLKAFGSIEKKKVADSEDLDNAIDNAWAKRYGGR